MPSGGDVAACTIVPRAASAAEQGSTCVERQPTSRLLLELLPAVLVRMAKVVGEPSKGFLSYPPVPDDTGRCRRRSNKNERKELGKKG
jgi:hypothetical protein